MARIEEMAKAIRDEAGDSSSFLVITHFDADGLGAGAIICKALVRLAAPFHVKIAQGLDEEVVGEASRSSYDVVIFNEIGSGYLDLIGGADFGGKRLMIIDHHQTAGDPPVGGIHVNPHDHGFDGSKEISGSGVAFLLSKSIDESNRDLAPLAVVGALGDMQDGGPRRSLTSLNEEIAQFAASIGGLEIREDLILYGRETRPIHRALAQTTSPFLPGLTGEEDRCLDLLASAGIKVKEDDKWRVPADLDEGEKQRLLSNIIGHLSSKGMSGELALELVGKVYSLPMERRWTPLRDGREYASLLNACGRMERPGLGISVCMGDRGSALEEANRTLAEYRRNLAHTLGEIYSNPNRVRVLREVVVILGDGLVDEGMTGAVSSMLSSSKAFDSKKVVVVSTKTKRGEFKISARLLGQSKELGINLGSILKRLSIKYSGQGGGHDVAAGAQVRMDLAEEFLKSLDDEVCEAAGTGAS
jgi:RecJ-like exonuclease